jgi:hypothetical protein
MRKSDVESSNVSLEYPNVSLELPNVSLEYPNVSAHDVRCKKCGHFFQNKAIYKHVKRCSGPLHPLQCHKCLKCLTTRQAKYKHIKICTGIAKELIAMPASIVNNNNTNNNVTNNNNITQNNNFYINVNPIGKETLAHLTHGEIMDMALNMVDFSGVRSFLQKVNFNPEVQENHNVRLTNGFTNGRSKEPLVMMKKDNNKWEKTCQTIALQELIKSMCGHMVHWIHKQETKEEFYKNSKEDDDCVTRQMADIQSGIHSARILLFNLHQIVRMSSIRYHISF